jgi:hypothetical protein
MCRGGSNAYAYRLDFHYNNFGDVFFIVKKRPLLKNFSIPHCGNFFFPQCSTPLVDIRFSRYIPNSLMDKNKMMHHPCLIEKVFFGLQNFAIPHWHMEKKVFHQL